MISPCSSALPPRERSEAYIAVADRLPRQPGKCPTCGVDLVGFCAGAIVFDGSDGMMDSIKEWFRFGCPVHDVFDLGSEFGAVLRHESDPAWSWAPPAWRPVLARTGWGLPRNPFPTPHPTLRIGSDSSQRTWVTDLRTLIAYPMGTTVADAEEAMGETVIVGDAERSARETARRRAMYRLGPVHIDPHTRLESYLAAGPPRPAPVVEGVDGFGGSHTLVRLGDAVLIKQDLAMIADLYPSVLWFVRGELDGVRGVDQITGKVIASVMPVHVERLRERMKRWAIADQANEAPCATCGHQHAGKELSYICVGCACAWSPLAAPEAAVETAREDVDAS